VWLLFSGESEQNSSPAEIQSILRLGLGSVVWTTDSDGVGSATTHLPAWESAAMSDSNDRRDDEKRELECLRLASDLNSSPRIPSTWN